MKKIDQEIRLLLDELTKMSLLQIIEMIDNKYLLENYSVKNTLLIFMQTKGKATIVKSYKQWQKEINPLTKEPIQINRGAKAIKIFVPKPIFYFYNFKQELTTYDKANQLEKRLIKEGKIELMQKNKCKLVGNVFDLSQTSAKDIDPMYWLNNNNNPQNHLDLLEIISSYVLKNQINLKFSNLLGQKYGKAILKKQANQLEKIIFINVNLSLEEQIITIFHELSHHLLHLEKIYHKHKVNQTQMEIEAELISYLLAKKYQLTTATSKAYISLHLKQLAGAPNVQEIIENSLIIVNQISEYITSNQKVI